ncbi:MAG: hypothetical protein WCG83_02145 [Candidatus Peregrinibacteria bacterium]
MESQPPTPISPYLERIVGREILAPLLETPTLVATLIHKVEIREKMWRKLGQCNTSNGKEFAHADEVLDALYETSASRFDEERLKIQTGTPLSKAA